MELYPTPKELYLIIETRRNAGTPGLVKRSDYED